MTRPGKRLIVTADDFGASSAVNEAIVRGHRQGIVTSASLMANGAAFPEAVALARENPDLALGVHLSLVRGRPILPRDELPRLLGRGEELPDNPVVAGFRYFFDTRLRTELEDEVEAQLRRVFDTGLSPCHLNGHLDLHVHPSVLRIALDAARRHGIRAIRLPIEPLGVNLRLDRRRLPAKLLHAGIYRCLCAYAAKLLRTRGFIHPDRFFGLLASGHVTEAYLTGVIDSLPAGVTEIGVHPAVRLPPELAAWAPDYEYTAELAALTSPRVGERLRENGVQLIGYDAFCKG